MTAVTLHWLHMTDIVSRITTDDCLLSSLQNKKSFCFAGPWERFVSHRATNAEKGFPCYDSNLDYLDTMNIHCIPLFPIFCAYIYIYVYMILLRWLTCELFSVIRLLLPPVYSASELDYLKINLFQTLLVDLLCYFWMFWHIRKYRISIYHAITWCRTSLSKTTI